MHILGIAPNFTVLVSDAVLFRLPRPTLECRSHILRLQRVGPRLWQDLSLVIRRPDPLAG